MANLILLTKNILREKKPHCVRLKLSFKLALSSDDTALRFDVIRLRRVIFGRI